MKKNKKYKVTLLSIVSFSFFVISAGAATPRAASATEVYFSNIPGGGTCKVAVQPSDGVDKQTKDPKASVKGWTTSSLGGYFAVINGSQDRRSDSASLNNSLQHPNTTAEAYAAYFPRVCTNSIEWGSSTDAYIQWSPDYIYIP